MFEAATVPNWVVVIYEGQRRSALGVVNQMIKNFAEACKAVGKTSQQVVPPAVLKVQQALKSTLTRS